MVHELQQQAKQFVTETHKVVQVFVGGNDVANKSEHVKEEIKDLMATTRRTFP